MNDRELSEDVRRAARIHGSWPVAVGGDFDPRREFFEVVELPPLRELPTEPLAMEVAVVRHVVRLVPYYRTHKERPYVYPVLRFQFQIDGAWHTLEELARKLIDAHDDKYAAMFGEQGQRTRAAAATIAEDVSRIPAKTRIIGGVTAGDMLQVAVAAMRGAW